MTCMHIDRACMSLKHLVQSTTMIATLAILAARPLVLAHWSQTPTTSTSCGPVLRLRQLLSFLGFGFHWLWLVH